MKNIEDIMEKFWEDYEENPEGWSFWTDKSEDFYNIYVVQEDKGYFIKLDSIYTNNPLGMGAKIKVEKDQLEKDLPNFGFRKFTKDELKNFMETFSEVENELERKNLLKEQMRKKPTLPADFDEDEYMLVGPLNQGNPFRYPLDRQEKVEKELRKKLKKKFRTKYLMYR
ncbi:MAG: hypothetical protein ACOCTR_05750 [Candidatus Natronoplasma sp.]